MIDTTTALAPNTIVRYDSPRSTETYRIVELRSENEIDTLHMERKGRRNVAVRGRAITRSYVIEIMGGEFDGLQTVNHVEGLRWTVVA